MSFSGQQQTSHFELIAVAFDALYEDLSALLRKCEPYCLGKDDEKEKLEQVERFIEIFDHTLHVSKSVREYEIAVQSIPPPLAKIMTMPLGHLLFKASEKLETTVKYVEEKKKYQNMRSHLETEASRLRTTATSVLSDPGRVQAPYKELVSIFEEVRWKDITQDRRSTLLMAMRQCAPQPSDLSYFVYHSLYLKHEFRTISDYHPNLYALMKETECLLHGVLQYFLGHVIQQDLSSPYGKYLLDNK